MKPERQTCSKTSAAGAFLLAFIKAKKDLQLYPAGNVAVIESVKELLESLKEHYRQEEVVEVLVERNRLLVNSAQPGLNDPRLKDLSLSLFMRGVRKILLDPCIPLEEMKMLLGILNLQKDKIARAGGIDKLTKSRNIIHAAVEESPELMILDGDDFSISSNLFEGRMEERPAEDEEAPVETVETFGRMFVRIQAGDDESLKRLQALLKRPTRFSHLLEKFALHLEQVGDEVGAVPRIEQLLKIFRVIGTASGRLPTEDERTELLRNLAISVLNMSAGIRSDLVQTGLAPNLPLKGVESDLLSLFPVSKVAEALLKNFQISNGTAAVVQSYFNNLKLSPSGRTELAGALRAGLKQEGSLTAEIEAVLTAESAAPEVLVTENAILFHQHPFLQLERYPANKILLTEDERVQLRDEAARQARLSTAEVMAPSLLNLMRYVNAPANYAPLAARARSYMDSFLESENYEKAAQFLQALQEEFERIEDTLSPEQAQPFRSLLDEFCGEERTRKVAQSFRDIHGEGADFQRLLRYFRVVGKAAVPSLMRALEEEESRHARLLICKVIGQIGGQNIPAIAEKLIHPAWYVVRNAVSILGQTGSPKSVQFLRMTLGHDDARVRKEVLRALAAIRSAEAVESLCLALDDPDVSVCKTALGWIAAIESEQALPALQRLLENRAIFKKDDEFLKLTIEAVKAVNTPPAIQSLERLTRTRSFFRRRKAALIRRLARAAVDEMKERYGA